MELRYVTEDGMEFESEAEAQAWEQALENKQKVQDYLVATYPDMAAKSIKVKLAVILEWEKNRNQVLGQETELKAVG